MVTRHHVENVYDEIPLDDIKAPSRTYVDVL